MNDLLDILEKHENFTITEALKDCKNTFDLLCIINYILDNIIDEEKNNFAIDELVEIKNKILNTKNKYYKKQK